MWRLDVELGGVVKYGGLYASRVEAADAQKLARKDWAAFEASRELNEEEDYSVGLRPSAPINLRIDTGRVLTIEPVTRVVCASNANNGVVSPEDDPRRDDAAPMKTGARRVLMSLPRVRWLERPDPCP